LIAIAVLCALPALAQRGGGRGAPNKPEDKPEEGIPVTNPLVIAKCGGLPSQR